ncbi:RloB family protein [Rhodococcus erythropolis]|uniref:RloB family protein n=1 Tax=Rhodococcus erythropolis TaxID=1833 RepID=UPI001586AEA3|nr:RloB family protein [Rhodococcus erythropolis]
MAKSASSSQRRRRSPRNLVKRILVVSEGEQTEPQYVERLASFLRSKESSTHVKWVGVGKDPLKVVRKCIELREDAANKEKGYDICVSLVDVDQHALLDAACALARKEQIYLLVTNLKFEMWLRWHVEDSRSVLNSSKLDELVTKLGIIKGKALPASFPIEKVDAACNVARIADPNLDICRVGPDPSSSMPVLVDLLRGER